MGVQINLIDWPMPLQMTRSKHTSFQKISLAIARKRGITIYCIRYLSEGCGTINFNRWLPFFIQACSFSTRNRPAVS